MRVFDTYYYNIIDKVRYKETKPYLEKMLQELGLSYRQLAFMLSDLRENVNEKVFLKYPELKKYEYVENKHGLSSYGMTSVRENWAKGECYVAPGDIEDVSAVFSKIPNPFNYPFGELVLDGIDWFEGEGQSAAGESKQQNIAVEDWESENQAVLNNLPYVSNRIKQSRFYNDGRKYNNVSVTIEVTIPEQGENQSDVKDSGMVIHRLKEYLGEHHGFSRKCIFDKEEIQKHRELCKKHSKKLKELGDTALPKTERTAQTMFSGLEVVDGSNISDKFTVVDKSMLNRIFKGSGFVREKGTPNLLHKYSCEDDNGYKYEAYIQKISYSNEFRCSVEISGYNFRIEYTHEDYVVLEGEAADILKEYVKFCEKLVKEYSLEIKKDFGMTPTWYHETK